MALFIKTFIGTGHSNLVNANQVLSFNKEGNKITYTPACGRPCGYDPELAYCGGVSVDVVFDEISRFISSNENGVLDLESIIKNLQSQSVKK